MTHKEYLEMLIGPLAGEGGGGGITPSGSITINKNTNGVDVTDKATAVVAVQGGLDAGYVPYVIPTGYPEYPCVENKTREQIETYDPEQVTVSRFWVVWDDAHPPLPAQNAKVAITGVTSDTHDPYMVLATTAGSPTQGEGKLRLRVVYDAPPTFGVGNPVMDITANGNNIDVKGRNAVNVNVPSVQPTGSVTLTKNTDNTGVDVTNKAKAIVAVQGGADANYVYPSIPTGYREIHTVSLKKSVVQGYTAGQTNKSVSTPLPMWMTLNVGDKIALTGYAQETGEPFVIAGTVSGVTSYGTYQYPKLTIDYNGYVGDSPTIPSGYTEIKSGCPLSRSTVLGDVAGTTNKSLGQVSIAETIAVGDKICVTGITQDTGEPYAIAGTVSAVQQYTTYQYPKVTIDVSGAVGLVPGLYINNNSGTDIDVKGREFVKLTSDLIKPTGTKQITSNGQSLDVKQFAYVDVAVPTSSGVSFTDLTGVRTLDENGISADYRTPNTAITGLCFPDLENLNTGNFNFFSALTDVYFGQSFQAIKGMSFDQCSSLAGMYFDYYASYLPTIMNGYVPGMSTQCIYYMPASLLQQVQWDQNWGPLLQQGRLIELDQAPYSPVVIYQSGQSCVFGGYTWQNQGLAGHLGKPGVDPAWYQV